MTVNVNAVTYFRIVDPVRSVVAVEDHVQATQQFAQTTLRSILGQTDLDDLLIDRDEVNRRLQKIIDEVTNPWGVKVDQRPSARCGNSESRWHARPHHGGRRNRRRVNSTCPGTVFTASLQPQGEPGSLVGTRSTLWIAVERPLEYLMNTQSISHALFSPVPGHG